MTHLRTLRLVTAVLLGLSAVAFTLGVTLERAALSHEQAASRSPGAAAPATTPPTSASVSPPTSPASQRPTATPKRRPTPSAARPTKQPPEGSPAREAQERAAAAAKGRPTAKPSPAPAKTAPTSTASRSTAAAGPAIPAEGSPEREAQERAGQKTTATTEASERLFGIDVESTAVIVFADLVTLLLIVALLLTPSGTALTLVAAATVAFGLSATVLDIREVLHQQREGRTALVAVAILVVVLHVAAALSAAVLAARSRRNPQVLQSP